jgi:flagellin
MSAPEPTGREPPEAASSSDQNHACRMTKAGGSPVPRDAPPYLCVLLPRLTQIDQLARDGSYNGVNLLTSARTKLHIGFNERDTANIDVAGIDMTFTGLGLAAIDLTTAAGAFQTDTEITAALDAVSNATERLRANTAAFRSGLTIVQNRQDFTKKLADILQTGSAYLVHADLNEEAATSQAHATRQSLATSSLTLANQAHQSVLRLLQ